MRRAALAAADIILIPLAVAPDTEAAKDTIEAVEAALAEDGKRRVMIGVSSASSWAGGTQGPAPWTAEDVERRAPVRGPGKLVADAERLVARAHKPGRLECFCVLPGTLYGEGEFEDGFLGLCRRAWEGESVPVFGDGSNMLPLCHAGHVAAVAKALAVEKTSVESLVMDRCGLGAECVAPLVEMLKVNTTLTSLDLSFSGFDEAATQQLEDAAKEREERTGVELDLPFAGVEEEVTE